MKSQTLILEDDNTVPVSQFYPELKAVSTLLPEAVIKLKIIEAVIHIADEVSAVNRKVELNLQPGVYEYPLNVPREQVVRITKHPSCCDKPDCALPTRPETTGIRDKLWLDVETQRVHLKDCKVKCSETVCFGAITVPERDACEVPSVFFNLYYSTVIKLAMAELLNMPEVPWSDPSKAGVNYRMGMRMVNNIRGANAMRNASGPIRIKNRRMV